jgi:hypothetical protein
MCMGECDGRGKGPFHLSSGSAQDRVGVSKRNYFCKSDFSPLLVVFKFDGVGFLTSRVQETPYVHLAADMSVSCGWDEFRKPAHACELTLEQVCNTCRV